MVPPGNVRGAAQRVHESRQARRHGALQRRPASPCSGRACRRPVNGVPRSAPRLRLSLALGSQAMLVVIKRMRRQQLPVTVVSVAAVLQTATRMCDHACDRDVVREDTLCVGTHSHTSLSLSSGCGRRRAPARPREQSRQCSSGGCEPTGWTRRAAEEQ